MSIELRNIILHQFTKNEQDELAIHLRTETLENNVSAECLITELNRVYNNKNNKGFAVFAEDSDFSEKLTDLRTDDLSFLSFSDYAAQRLHHELVKYPFADAGTLVIAEYQMLATDYLFIGLVFTRHGMKVTEQLEVGSTDYLDAEKMDIAARIDLSAWESGIDSNRYLTFTKGRVGRRIADFFLDSMGADVSFNPKAQNQVLMQAVEDFCSESQLDKEEKQQCRKQVYDYCNDQLRIGDEVTVKELSGELPTSDEGVSFYDFTSKQGYELEESFPADRATIRKLTKFTGSGGGMTLSFDNQLLGERIFYDAETDTLTIKGTPPNLKDQIIRREQAN